MLNKSSSRFRALDAAEPFDVCIIGSGFAGTVIGKSLAERGIRTVIIESGESLSRWLFNTRIRTLAKHEVSGDTDYPLTRTHARAVGGTSNFWTGRSERLHPLDFEKNSYTPEGVFWPITYAEIEPYYQQAEETLRVRGGALSSYHAPRKNKLPLPPTTDISSLKSILAEVGVTVDDSPTATPAKGWRFFRVQKEILPDFLASPHALLVSGLTVTRLISNGDGRIIGAQAANLRGDSRIVRARCYVVACGGIESPRLLLLSRSKTFPNGIGNGHDRVGRGFNEHPGVNFYGSIRHRWSTIYPRHKIGRSHQFYDQFKHEGLGGVHPVFIQSWVLLHHQMRFKISNLPQNVLSILGRMRRALLHIGATVEMPPCDSNRVTLSENAKDCFGNPVAHLSFSYTEDDRKTLDRTRALIRQIYHSLDATDVKEADLTWSCHHIGTCRMGDNPKTSVVDRNLRVHESPNLHVCGSEVFVTGGGLQPVLTITALAHRLADHLASQFSRTATGTVVCKQ